MTDVEYKKRYESISVSDAPASVKQAALKILDDQYYGAPRRALKLINESAPEPIKGGLD